MKFKPSKRRTFAPPAITKSVQEAADALRMVEGMRKQLALAEQTAIGVFTARNAPMPTTPLALAVLLGVMWHGAAKAHGSDETLNVGGLCEMMRIGLVLPSGNWPVTSERMVAAYSDLDPEWAKTRPQKGWGPRLEPAPKVEKAIQAIMTGLDARLGSNSPMQTHGDKAIFTLNIPEEAQSELFLARCHAGRAVVGTHLGGRLGHVGLVPGVEMEDGAWWKDTSLISIGSPHVLGVLMAGLIAELLPYALDSGDPILRKHVLEDAEVRACAYDLALPDGGSDEGKVLAALEQVYGATYQVVQENELGIDTLACFLVSKRWASEQQCSEIISMAKSLPQQDVALRSGERVSSDVREDAPATLVLFDQPRPPLAV